MQAWTPALQFVAPVSRPAISGICRRGRLHYNHPRSVAKEAERLEFDPQGHFLREPIALKDGRRVLIRPTRAGDKPGVEAMLRTCSDETLYRRFLAPGLKHPLRYLDRLIAHDPPRIVTLVAETEKVITVNDRVITESVKALTDNEKAIVALANYVETEPGKTAEIALLIADPFQNRGLGSALFNCLCAIGRSYRVEDLVADINAENARVFSLIKHKALPARIEISMGVAHAVMDLVERGS